MIGVRYLLAKKYAVAFINIFSDQVTEQLCTKIVAVRNLLRERHELLYIVSLPQVSDDTKKRALQLILPEELFKTLIMLIIKHKRILLLPEILDQIIMEYRKKNNIEHFIITSSHQLPLESLDVLVQFLAVHTHHVVTYDHIIDTSLIAGIRMQSDIHLWEYSIQKQLQHIRGMLIS
jgi:ATP synthase F1 delta subunit